MCKAQWWILFSVNGLTYILVISEKKKKKKINVLLKVLPLKKESVKLSGGYYHVKLDWSDLNCLWKKNYMTLPWIAWQMEWTTL